MSSESVVCVKNSDLFANTGSRGDSPLRGLGQRPMKPNTGSSLRGDVGVEQGAVKGERCVRARIETQSCLDKVLGGCVRGKRV